MPVFSGMKPNLLLMHGNGGSRTRFLPALDLLNRSYPDLQVVTPQLSGFDGRWLPPSEHYWDVFLQDLYESIADLLDQPWVLYGHGIGASLLMELAARQFVFPNGQVIPVKGVILHSAVGPALDKRIFPSLMKPMPVRRLGRWLVTRPWLQEFWEKRLFRYPDTIDPALRRQFFEDYTTCTAFPVFFDLITPAWYKRVRSLAASYPFYFLWGDKERVLNVRLLKYLRQDFPHSRFEIVPGWDHFPMLETPSDFVHRLVHIANEKC